MFSSFVFSVAPSRIFISLAEDVIDVPEIWSVVAFTCPALP